MKCPACNNDNPEDAKFCGHCGKPMPEAVKPAPDPEPRPPSPIPPNEPVVSSGLNIGVIVGSLLIPLLGIIVGIIFMSDDNAEKKLAGRRWLMVGGGVFVAYCLLSVICGVMTEMTNNPYGY